MIQYRLAPRNIKSKASILLFRSKPLSKSSHTSFVDLLSGSAGILLSGFWRIEVFSAPTARFFADRALNLRKILRNLDFRGVGGCLGVESVFTCRRNSWSLRKSDNLKNFQVGSIVVALNLKWNFLALALMLIFHDCWLAACILSRKWGYPLPLAVEAAGDRSF